MRRRHWVFAFVVLGLAVVAAVGAQQASSRASSFFWRPARPRRTDTVISPSSSGRVSMANREARFSSQGRSKSQSTNRGVFRKNANRCCR
jgi:hypothetical protein